MKKTFKLDIPDLIPYNFTEEDYKAAVTEQNSKKHYSLERSLAVVKAMTIKIIIDNDFNKEHYFYESTKNVISTEINKLTVHAVQFYMLELGIDLELLWKNYAKYEVLTNTFYISFSYETIAIEMLKLLILQLEDSPLYKKFEFAFIETLNKTFTFKPQ